MNPTNEIVFFIPEVVGGGAERVVCQLTSALAQAGCQVTLMLLQDRKRAYTINSDVKVIVLPTARNPFKKIIVRICAIRNYLRKHSGAILVSFLFRTLIYAFPATLGLKNKWIVSERNNPRVTPENGIHRLIRNLAFLFADKCVFQTEDAKNYFTKTVRRKGVIIPNPIPDIQPKRVPNDKHIIINACRLSKQKNLPLLLEAFKEITKTHPEYILELYGEGEERDSLQRMVNELQLSEYVRMPGFAFDISDKLRNAEIFVSSSDYEGISNSMLEAMSIGLPVVCTDCPIGGARMMISHEGNGMLVPVGDKDALVEAILKLIENKDMAYSISRKAIDTCKQYSLDSIVQMWKETMHLS